MKGDEWIEKRMHDRRTVTNVVLNLACQIVIVEIVVIARRRCKVEWLAL